MEFDVARVCFRNKTQERTMSLLTASQECESIARNSYKLSFLERQGSHGEQM